MATDRIEEVPEGALVVRQGDLGPHSRARLRLLLLKSGYYRLEELRDTDPLGHREWFTRRTFTDTQEEEALASFNRLIRR